MADLTPSTSKRIKLDLRNMSLNDLMRAVESNGDLKDLATELTKRMNETVVHIANGPSFRIDQELRFENPSSLLTNQLIFLGPFIKKLKITFQQRNNGDFVQKVVDYINKYCTSVIEFQFINCTKTFIPSLKRPQSTVESVVFNNCSLGQKVKSLEEWFPYVKKMKFLGKNCIDNNQSIAVNFPQLEKLDVTIPNANKKEKSLITMDNISEILRMNTNLQSLSIGGEVTAPFIQSVSEYLNDLVNLEIVWNEHFYNPYNSYKSVNMQLNNVKKLKIVYLNNSGNIPLIPIKFVALEQFSFQKKFHKSMSYDLGPDLTRFISTQKNLKKLTIGLYTMDSNESENAILNIENKMELELPLLVEAELKYCTFEAGEIVEFINKCPSLSKLFVRLKRDQYDELIKCIDGNEWRHTFDRELNQIAIERLK